MAQIIHDLQDMSRLSWPKRTIHPLRPVPSSKPVKKGRMAGYIASSPTMMRGKASSGIRFYCGIMLPEGERELVEQIIFLARYSHMIGLGTIINGAAIVAGGVIGHFTGKLFRQDQQEAVNKACGISVLFIAIAGAMQGMLYIDHGKILSGKSMLVVLCLALGTIIGEIIGIEKGFEAFGEWLKMKSGNSGDRQFVNAFVTASLTVCIGAMAIVGAIQDGISGDYSTLAVKAVLDFIIIAVMTSSLGKGCVFSAIPVLLLEGVITLLARIISPVMTETAVAYLSLVGAVLIFCVGLNLVWGKKVRVANMLPAVLFAVLFAYLPWTF